LVIETVLIILGTEADTPNNNSFFLCASRPVAKGFWAPWSLELSGSYVVLLLIRPTLRLSLAHKLLGSNHVVGNRILYNKIIIIIIKIIN